MKAAGVTLNVFFVGTIKFLGHIISKEGLQIDSEKVKAIIMIPKPQNIYDDLLGMANQVGKFAKNLTDTIKPL